MGIEVDFQSLTEDLSDLCVNIYLLDSMGGTVLITANTPWANAVDDQWFGTRHEACVYRARYSLPADFLNEGRYYLSVYLVRLTPFRLEVAAEHAMSFATLDRGTMREPGMGGPGTARFGFGCRGKPLSSPRNG